MSRSALISILIACGAGWGITQPLAKIAVSTGYQHFGLIFWQMALGVLFLAPLLLMMGKRLPLTRRAFGLYVMVALVGTVVPNSASYQAVVHLPSGLMSVLLSGIPMVAFPVALLLGNDQFDWRRLAGLSFGLIGVLFIVLPESSLPDRALVGWVLIALIAPLCYAFEGNLVAKIGLGDLDPLQVLAGAMVVGTLVSLPLALGTGQMIVPRLPLSPADLAHIASSAIHVAVYTTYVWLVTRAGPTFAAQVSYWVTGFGVFWAIVLLGESYSLWIWGALALMLFGLFLVQPRRGADG